MQQIYSVTSCILPHYINFLKSYLQNKTNIIAKCLFNFFAFYIFNIISLIPSILLLFFQPKFLIILTLFFHICSISIWFFFGFILSPFFEDFCSLSVLLISPAALRPWSSNCVIVPFRFWTMLPAFKFTCSRTSSWLSPTMSSLICVCLGSIRLFALRPGDLATCGDEEWIFLFSRLLEPSNKDDLISLICTHLLELGQDRPLAPAPAPSTPPPPANAFHPQKCSLNFCNLLSCCESRSRPGSMALEAVASE